MRRGRIKKASRELLVSMLDHEYVSHSLPMNDLLKHRLAKELGHVITPERAYKIYGLTSRGMHVAESLAARARVTPSRVAARPQ